MNAGEQRATLKAALRVAGIGAALYAGVTVIGTFLQSTPLAGLIAQTVGTEWGAGRLGISWSDPLAPAPTTKAIAERIGKGALLGLVPAAALIELLHITHSATLRPASFALGSLLLGLLATVLTAVRDQILLSGVVLRVMSHTEATIPKILACGAMGAAHACTAPTPTVHEVLAAAALGLFAGVLWVRERGAFLAVAMNAGWLFATQILFRGVFVDVDTGANAFAGADGGMASGYAAAAALVVCAAGVFSGGRSFFAVSARPR